MKLKSVPRFISLGILLVASGMMVGLWPVPATGDTYNCEKIPEETINSAVPVDQVFGDEAAHSQHDGCPKWHQPTKAHTPDTPEFSTAVNALWNFFRTMIAFSAIWFIFQTFRNKEGTDKSGFAPYKIFKIILGATVALALTSNAGIDWIANLYNMSDQVVTGGTIASGDNQFTDIIEGSRQNLNLGLTSDPPPESGQTATGTTTTTLPPREPAIHWWVDSSVDSQYQAWFYYEQPDQLITAPQKLLGATTGGITTLYLPPVYINPNQGYFMRLTRTPTDTGVTVTAEVVELKIANGGPPPWVQTLKNEVGHITDSYDKASIHMSVDTNQLP